MPAPYGQYIELPYIWHRFFFLTVYAKEAGVVVASPADAGSEPGLRFAGVSRSELRECLADLLSSEEPAAQPVNQP